MKNETSCLNQNKTYFLNHNETAFLNQNETSFLNQNETSFLINQNETFSLNQEILSKHVQELILQVNGSILLVLAGAGMSTNVINTKIFRKLGLDSSINISFLSLSVTDFACAFFYSVLAVTMVDMSGVVDLGVDLAETTYVMAVLITSLATLGSWVTALISAERCCAVAFPMKVKRIFTKKLTTALIVGMLVTQIAAIATNLALFQYSVSSPTNSTGPQISVSVDRTLLLYVINSAACAPSLVCFAMILVNTIYLAVSLNQQSKWSQSAFGQRFHAAARNKKLAATVVCISTIYISCFLPIVVVSLFVVGAPDLTTSSRQVVFDTVLASFPVVTQAISSASNVLVYTKMNPAYRQHFKTMLCTPCAQIHARCFSE